MTPEEYAEKVEFNACAGSVNLLGGWELDEDDARQQIAAVIRDAVAEALKGTVRVRHVGLLEPAFYPLEGADA